MEAKRNHVNMQFEFFQSRKRSNGSVRVPMHEVVRFSNNRSNMEELQCKFKEVKNPTAMRFTDTSQLMTSEHMLLQDTSKTSKLKAIRTTQHIAN